MECHGQSHGHVGVRDSLHGVRIDNNKAVDALVVIIHRVHEHQVEFSFFVRVQDKSGLTYENVLFFPDEIGAI